ncbi:MAG: TetR/AcrR family transcriptional regulator [Planctomycetota bacterium]|nr:TetR/AcrR family transcriptional regulator [Planctomycetota bacterium]
MEIDSTSEPKRPPGRPKDQALQERRRGEILDQAADAFAKHGYANTDVQWISDALSVSKGTIYRYFPSKEDLFLAAVRRGVERLYEHIAVAKRDKVDSLDTITAAVVAYLQFFKANPQLVELFIQERSLFRDGRKPVFFEHRDAKRGPFRQLVARLMENGVIREMPVERFIDVLGDVLYGTMFTNFFAGRDKPFESQAQDILDLVFFGALSDEERARRKQNQ